MIMPQPKPTDLQVLSSSFVRAQRDVMLEALAFHDSRIADRSDDEDHDLGVAMRNRSLRAREEIATALEMIEEGRYGVCVGCQGSIAQERLEAVPHALVCSRCARS